jgi:hypothetical protein
VSSKGLAANACHASPLIGATNWLQMKTKGQIVDVQWNNKAVAEVSGYVPVARPTA